jgi:predicted permease
VPRQPFGARLYRRLLRLYPRDFRDEYGAEMSRLYRDRRREESGARLWLALLTDIGRSAPKEQLDVLTQDVRCAFRGFVQTPIVAATAVFTMAMALAASTSMFAVVYGVILRPLPYPDSDRLVELFEDNRPGNAPRFRVSALNYLSWAERARSTEALAAFQTVSLNLTDPGEPERLSGGAVTASMFRVLGLQPLVGRPLQSEDERIGAGRVALLGESFWRRRFGGDPAIVGRSISLNDERYEVIGVVPHAFRDVGRSRVSVPGEGPHVFVPLVIDPARENRGNHLSRVVGRLQPGVSLDRARDELRRIAAALEQEFPATNKGWGVQIDSVADSMFDTWVRPSLLLLLAAVGMVLLIACANVANMLFARGISRERELALRTALGAGRTRLVRQLVTESVCLAAMSGAVGVPLAVLALQVLGATLPPTLPRTDEIAVDATVLGLGVLLSFASGLVMGMMPAVRASRTALVPSLAQQGRGSAGSSRTFVRHGIVVVQMALATMLLVSSALLLQSFVRLQHVSLGFEPDGVITTRLALPRAKYADAARTWDFTRRLLEPLNGIPHVHAVSVATSAPFAPGVRVGGTARDAAAGSVGPDASIPAVEHFVSSDYFRVLDVPLLAGRSFGDADGFGAAPVAVIGASVARQLWAGQNPVGRRLDWNGAGQHEVIGVVGDLRGADPRGGRGGGLDREPTAAVYFPIAQSPQRGMTLLVRTSNEPSSMTPAIRRAVADIDAAQPVDEFRRLSAWIDDSTAQPRFTTTLSGVFAVVALLLAAVGVYGVLSYSVVQRTQEIGVRMAVGADPGRIVRLVLRGGLSVAVTGVAFGLLGAFVVSRALATLLFDVRADDPITYVVVGALLTLVAACACYIPAVRATRIDPLMALRG